MPDSKITALTSISTSTDPANDPLVIVDVSDTSMAATGTTKKVTLNQLLATSPTATLASATISGDLTVDTSTLKVDSANNRVGIGTASPAVLFHATLPAATYGEVGRFYDGSGNGISFTANAGSGFNQITSTGAQPLIVNVNSSERYRIASDGVATWSNVGGVAGTAMTLNSTGLGVGVTPSAGKGALQLSSGINFPATQVASTDPNTLDDYEEGTFTPTIVGTTTAGTGIYSTQQGRYTKIGNQVTVHIFLDWSAHTGTGNLRLAGLPFQSSNNFHACSIGFWNNIAVTAANVPMAYVINQETNIALLQMPSGGGAMAAIPMDTAGSFVLSATYTV